MWKRSFRRQSRSSALVCGMALADQVNDGLATSAQLLFQRGLSVVEQFHVSARLGLRPALHAEYLRISPAT